MSSPKKTLTSCALILALATVDARAHGGVYRGPGNVVSSPGTGSSSGSSGSSGSGGTGTITPGSAGTTTGGGNTPGTAGPRGAGPVIPTGVASRGPVGAPLDDDLTRWTYYWEFRKDSYLGLRAAVHATGTIQFSDTFFMAGGDKEGSDTLLPSEDQLRTEVLPPLHRALESTSQRDITSSCLVALAKLGLEDKYFALLPTLRARLTSHDQEIRETAALAMGISQRSGAVPDLVALLHDTDRGRRLCERSEVDDRTRSFAGYGLGLIAYGSPSLGVKRIVFEALRDVLDDDSVVGWNVPIAALSGVGLLHLDSQIDPAVDGLRSEALGLLARLHDADVGVGRQLVQAHIATAAAALLADSREASLRSAWIERLLDDLRGATTAQGSTRRLAVLGQSAALALGELAAPHEDGAPEAHVSEALLKAFEDGMDFQTSVFALTALGRIGGSRNVEALLEVLASGTKALERPWAALALGIHEHHRLASAGTAGRIDERITKALEAQLDEVKNPETLAALAVALGLSRARDASPKLRVLLDEHRSKDELAGYICLGLALMEDRSSIPAIREIVQQSGRRPQRLIQSAMALGRLGDKSAALALMDQMSGADQNLAVLSSLAFAVGRIGDRRTIPALVEMVGDTEMVDLARAFAVVAIGGVGDKESEPWSAKIGRLANYRAAVETLFNQASGILDIL
ncbi:MAG: HEAT repeat domain-containing protein [Planctomycetota bacterium]|nr:HEAT repeat domain-containing protein [Planctomycetota bacterium]